MDSKKVGATLIILTLALGSIIFGMSKDLKTDSQVQECNPSQQCQEIATTLGWTHIGMGALGALLSLGIYLLFFNTSEQAILDRLEREKEKSLAKERFAIMLKALDESEKSILRAVAEDEGVTQKDLTERTGLSKAKVSQVLSSFESKDIVKRRVKGRTYSVHLKKPL